MTGIRRFFRPGCNGLIVRPDHFNAFGAMSAPTPVNEHRFPCDTCGSDLRFDPASANLTCDHCGNTDTIETDDSPWSAIRELDFKTALSSALPESEIEETRVITCPNCGAQTEFDEEVHAKECPYCATPVVTDTGTHRHVKPKGLLPFALTEEQARDAMTEWLGRLWFAPNGLQQYARKGRSLKGIYVPYWTFDADTKTSYRGARGTVHHRKKRVTRNGKSQTITVTDVRWTSKSGRVARFFDDVLVLASQALPKKHTDALEPWDLSGLVPYNPEFLAGFRAEAYQIELEDGFVAARSHMDKIIQRDVRFDIGGDRQRIDHIDTTVKDITFKHILLPIWMAAYKYRGKSYRFVVNARTGRVKGERPYSAWKIAIVVLLAAILAGGIGYLVALEEVGRL